MARELKTWPLLDGFRGRPKADVEALVDAIVAFSAHGGAAWASGWSRPRSIRVFVLPQGQGVRAADGVVVLGWSTVRGMKDDAQEEAQALIDDLTGPRARASNA